MADEFEGVRLVVPGMPQKEEPENNPTPKGNEVPPGVIDLSEGEEGGLFNRKPETFGTPEVPETHEQGTTVYSALIKELVDNGIIDAPGEDTVVESSEDLVALFDRSVNSKVNQTLDQFKGSFSGAKKMFLEIEDYFDDETVAMKVAKDLDYYGRITPAVIKSNEAVQKDLVSRYLRMKGMNQNEIAEALKEADALAKLEDKALQAFPQLQQAASQFIEGKKQEAAMREHQREQQTQEFFNNMLKGVDEAEELVPGIQLIIAIVTPALQQGR